ncbi:MAG: TnpV protein [Lachnospiraceae bacterium]|nr:TnpV protein [Lachnospiraceae bacterium]
MEKLPKYKHENGIDYVLAGDYYIPMLALPEENRPIGRWGRMHRDYLEECRRGYYCSLLLTGKLWTYLADLNEQAEERLDRIIRQMQAAEGVTEQLKADDQLEWVRRTNSIRNRAEEIIRAELIYI